MYALHTEPVHVLYNYSQLRHEHHLQGIRVLYLEREMKEVLLIEENIKLK